MKRVLSLFLSFLLLLPLGAAAAAEPSVTPIRDAEGMFAIRSNPWGAYRLEADIDMSTVVWSPIPFKGQLDGGGHTLYNLTVTNYGSERRTVADGERKTYETVFAGLFSTVEDAEISDLHLRGALVEFETMSNCFVGGLAGYVDRSTITHCSVEGRLRVSGTGALFGLGGLVGYGCGVFSDCDVDVELVAGDQGASGAREQYMGGVLACGFADIDRNTVSLRGWDSRRGSVHDGGLVGLYARCDLSYAASSVRNNYIGGFIGLYAASGERRVRSGVICGELPQQPSRYSGNRNDFERRETADNGVPLLPEKCGEPAYAEDVTAPGCANWGYTKHSCAKCGYTWTDSYTPPAHRAEWRVSVSPTEYSAGQEQLRCTVCDTLLDERTLPPLVRVESCTLDRRRATLYLTETLRLNAEVLPENATGSALSWSSSDPSVASVDDSGVVRALGRGRTFITVQTADGLGRDTCTVTVRYSLMQWLRSLFGSDR